MGRWVGPPLKTTDEVRHIIDWGAGAANAQYALATTMGERPTKLLTVSVKYAGGSPNSGTEVEVWYRAGHGSDFDALLAKDTIGPDKTFVFAPSGTIAACGHCVFEVVCAAAGASSVARATIVTVEL